MLPIGMLMIEHRLIEKMISLIKNELDQIKRTKKADLFFIEQVIDFISIYADQCHHGKEEDILFAELKNKELSEEHKKIMDDLINEHIYGRETVGSLIKAQADYKSGNKSRLQDIEESLDKLVKFYPQHIDKKDHKFFRPAMDYFNDQEKEEMLERCREFDREMIHKKYKAVIDVLRREK